MLRPHQNATLDGVVGTTTNGGHAQEPDAHAYDEIIQETPIR